VKRTVDKRPYVKGIFVRLFFRSGTITLEVGE